MLRYFWCQDASPDGVVTLARTKTGIISNRRPVAGTPIGTSGTSTPLSASENDTRARLSLLAAAKREAARARLYSRFFRGPVLGPYVEDDALAEAGSSTIVVATMVIEATTLEDGAPKEKKKRRRASDAEGDEEEVKAEMKRVKREAKAARKAERAERRANKEERRRRKAAEVEGDAADHESYPAPGRAERKGKGKDITVHGDAQAVERPSGGVKKRKGTQRAKADDGLGNEFINSRDSATSSPSTRTRSPREDVQEDYEPIDGLRDTTLDSSRQGDGKKRRRKRKESSMSST